MRWDRQLSQILHDPEGKIRQLFDEKLVYPESERKRRLESHKAEAHEHLIYYPEMWLERGELWHLIDFLWRGVQDVVLWIYARNRLFEPYTSKWLFWHLEHRAAPEWPYLEVFKGVCMTSYETEDDVLAMRDKLVRVCSKIGLRWRFYSNKEAHDFCSANWARLPGGSKDLLSWSGRADSWC